MGRPRTINNINSEAQCFRIKILIYIWWDEWDVLYYELLKLGETVTGKYYSLQLNHLAEKNSKKDLLRDVGIDQ